MSWTKRGRLWDPSGAVPWGRTHAALPTLDHIAGDDHWLYFSSRDELGRALIGRARVRLLDGTIEVIEIASDPVLGLGSLGAFDDSGVTNSWIVALGRRRLLYYSGWTRGVTVPFYFYVGLAVSDDDGASFRRHSPAPILERTRVDPYLTASPCVLADNGTWRMWYVSALGWETHDGVPSHRYHIRAAESADGLTWNRTGSVSIDFADEREHSISRPCVERDAAGYRMWFAARGESYRLGYAESADGVEWRRDDAQAGIDVSPEGWDSEMVCYPIVHRHAGCRYMLYNGNGYGATGVLYAVADDPRA